MKFTIYFSILNRSWYKILSASIISHISVAASSPRQSFYFWRWSGFEFK